MKVEHCAANAVTDNQSSTVEFVPLGQGWNGYQNATTFLFVAQFDPTRGFRTTVDLETSTSGNYYSEIGASADSMSTDGTHIRVAKTTGINNSVNGPLLDEAAYSPDGTRHAMPSSSTSEEIYATKDDKLVTVSPTSADVLELKAQVNRVMHEAGSCINSKEILPALHRKPFNYFPKF